MVLQMLFAKKVNDDSRQSGGRIAELNASKLRDEFVNSGSSNGDSTCDSISSANKQSNKQPPLMAHLTLRGHLRLIVSNKWKNTREEFRHFKKNGKVFREQSRSCLRKVERIMCPSPFKRFYHKYGLKHVVLLLAVTSYSLLGALTFVMLERPEQENRFSTEIEILSEKRALFIDSVFGKVFNDTKTFLLFIDSQQSKTISNILQKQLVEYEGNIIKHLHFYRMKVEWNFANAVLYSWTLITTIGYGHMYPMTMGGRIATMIYALIGIPLTLVCLNDLGKVLTRVMKYPWFIGKKWGRRMFQYCSKQTRTQIAALEQKDRDNLDVFDLPIPIAIAIVVGWIFICSAIQLLWEKDWTFFEAFYFFYISLSTIGLGDIEPSEPQYLLYMFGNIIVGLSLVSMCINLISSKLEKTYQATNKSQDHSPLAQIRERLRNHRDSPENDVEDGAEIMSLASGKLSISSSKSAPGRNDSGCMSLTSQQQSMRRTSPRWVRMKMAGSLKSAKSLIGSTRNSEEKLSKSMPENVIKQRSLIEVSMANELVDDDCGRNEEAERRADEIVNNYRRKRIINRHIQSSINGEHRNSAAQTSEFLWPPDASLTPRSKSYSAVKPENGFDSPFLTGSQSEQKLHESMDYYSIKEKAQMLKRELSMYENWSPLKEQELQAQIRDEAQLTQITKSNRM